MHARLSTTPRALRPAVLHLQPATCTCSPLPAVWMSFCGNLLLARCTIRYVDVDFPQRQQDSRESE